MPDLYARPPHSHPFPCFLTNLIAPEQTPVTLVTDCGRRLA